MTRRTSRVPGIHKALLAVQRDDAAHLELRTDVEAFQATEGA